MFIVLVKNVCMCLLFINSVFLCVFVGFFVVLKCDKNCSTVVSISFGVDASKSSRVVVYVF